MKRLVLIRHAKSSWGGVGLADFDRPLNERGKRDAPEMAQRLFSKKIKIDAFISSPAKRAKSTCKAFCKVFKVPEDEIIFIDELYHANTDVFNKVIRSLNNKYGNIALFSHNPGITDFANSLCEGIRTDNMPTCAVFAVESDITEWNEFENAGKKFLFFEYPKSGGS
ncbi:MAG TPA: histidine phosphatase family protein [Ferruginibacter sp.]|nr:histidine phosphatase family protein [Ferruginibacter sp.]